MPTRTVTAEPPAAEGRAGAGPTQNANDSGDVPRRTSGPPYGLPPGTPKHGRYPADQASSISGVRFASVPGTPRSVARLSAMASSRRIRPAAASLVIGGVVGGAVLPQ